MSSRRRRTNYRSQDEARTDIFDFIEMFYNKVRRHSYLGGVSPEAFELASKTAVQVSAIYGEV